MPNTLSTPARLLANSLLLSDGLEDGSANPLLAKAQVKRFGKGHAFFRKGDPGDVMFAITRGMVRICSCSEDGKEVVLGILGEGDLFGEISLLDGQNRAADAVAITEGVALLLSRQDFIDHIESSPVFALGLMRSLARRLRATDSQVEDAVFLSLPGRLAKRLLMLARDYGVKTANGVRIQIKLSQQDLANLVGVSRESVNRLLASWLEDGLLAKEGRYLVLQNIVRMERLAAS